MAPHSSTLAWKIPWTEEPGRLWSMGSLKVGHDYCGQEIPLEKWSSHHSQQKSPNAVLGCNLKNDRMISVHFKANHSISQ